MIAVMFIDCTLFFKLTCTPILEEKNHYYKRELYTISDLTSSQMR